jgi:hypothetical protein
MKKITGILTFLITLSFSPLASAGPMSGTYESVQGTNRTVTITQDYYHTYARYMNYNTSVLYIQNNIGSFFSGSWNFTIRPLSPNCFLLNWGTAENDQLCLKQNQNNNLLKDGLYYSVRGTEQYIRVFNDLRTQRTFVRYLDFNPSLLTFQNDLGYFSSGPLFFTLRISKMNCFILTWGGSGSDELCFSYSPH